MTEIAPSGRAQSANAERVYTPRVLLSVEAAAEQLSLSRTRIFGLIKAGEIESVKVGRLRRIPATALERYVNRVTALQHNAA